jgi:hypothetical protein
MDAKRGSLIVVLVLTILPVAACGQEAAEAGHEPPAVMEEIAGSDISRIRLTQSAIDRIALETAAVEEAGSRLTVPYGAVFYGIGGDAWIYTNPEPMVYVREHVAVDRIDGDVAYLSEGPEPGTMVVTVGVAELFGTETGVGGSAH